MPMQGSMKSQRRAAMRIAISALVLAAFPAAAHASPLLSGYGGPGQGTQAILGAALVNGPSGGGGGSRGGGSQAAGAPSSSPGGQPTGSEARRSAAIRPGNALRGHRTVPGRAGGATLATGAARSAGTSNLPAGAYPVSETGVAQSSAALGLSTAGLLEAFAVLCALVATIVLTRRLTRAAPRPGGTDEQLGVGG